MERLLVDFKLSIVYSLWQLTILNLFEELQMYFKFVRCFGIGTFWKQGEWNAVIRSPVDEMAKGWS